MLREDDDIELNEAAVNAQMAVATRAERQYMVIGQSCGTDWIEGIYSTHLISTNPGDHRGGYRLDDIRTGPSQQPVARRQDQDSSRLHRRLCLCSVRLSRQKSVGPHQRSRFRIFSVLYVLDAVRARNIVQLGLHMVLNICILAYSILQIPQTKTALSGLGLRRCGNFEASDTVASQKPKPADGSTALHGAKLAVQRSTGLFHYPANHNWLVQHRLCTVDPQAPSAVLLVHVSAGWRQLGDKP